MSGANVAGADTRRLESEDRVIMTASPRNENSVLATRTMKLVGTRFDVRPFRETASISDDALTCDDIVVSRAAPAGCYSERPDTVRITEGNYPEACQHSDASVCTLGLLHKSANGVEYVLLVDTKLVCLLKVIGEYIKQKFRVGRGVDMTVGTSIHEVKQSF